VARQLQQIGFAAAALQGGLDAWRDRYPVEPITGQVTGGRAKDGT
jgi:hypothetical protein